MSEYNNTSQGAPCSFASLGNYNADYSLNGVPAQGRVVSGKFIVPQYNAIGYDSLTSPVLSCSGYGNITTAYGKDASSCQTTYRTSLCGTK